MRYKYVTECFDCLNVKGRWWQCLPCDGPPTTTTQNNLLIRTCYNLFLTCNNHDILQNMRHSFVSHRASFALDSSVTTSGRWLRGTGLQVPYSGKTGPVSISWDSLFIKKNNLVMYVYILQIVYVNLIFVVYYHHNLLFHCLLYLPFS
jgi:hypothetical protein